jgi:hypothetical protein
MRVARAVNPSSLRNLIGKHLRKNATLYADIRAPARTLYADIRAQDASSGSSARMR